MIIPEQLDGDERLGLASGSAMLSYSLCEGKWRAERESRTKLKASDVAERGTRIHRALESGEDEGLADEKEAASAKLSRELERAAIEEFREWVGAEECDLVTIREHRMWIRSGLHPVCSVKPDLVALHEPTKSALVLDLKTGWKEVPDPSVNDQLRTAAVALHQNHRMQRVWCQIIGPSQKDKRPALYERADLDAAHCWLFDILERIYAPGALRTPGPVQCQFCAAKANCREAKAAMLAISTRVKVRWDELRPDHKVRLWEAAAVAEQVADGIRDLVRQELEANADAIPGLIIGGPGTRRKIKSAAAFASALSAEHPAPDGAIEKHVLAKASLSVENAISIRRSVMNEGDKESSAWVSGLPETVLKVTQVRGQIERVATPKQLRNGQTKQEIT